MCDFGKETMSFSEKIQEEIEAISEKGDFREIRIKLHHCVETFYFRSATQIGFVVIEQLSKRSHNLL